MGNSGHNEQPGAVDWTGFRALVNRQHGRITCAQLNRVGISNGSINKSVKAGRLIRVLPRVYAVGHTAESRLADLWAAVLYAGPGAGLSHRTAAHHRGLIDFPPTEIEVSTSRQVRSLPGVNVYGRRAFEREAVGGLPVTTIPQTVQDLARVGDVKLVRRALSQLDYRKALDIQQLLESCGRGKLGTENLRKALATHQPQLARTNGPLEEEFLEWCERHEVPIPEFNVRVHGILVDAHWPQPRVVVELDGRDNHSSPAQIRRDRSNDLKLRRHGLTVLRYDWSLLQNRPQEVRTDILATISGRKRLETTSSRRSVEARPAGPLDDQGDDLIQGEAGRV